MFENHQTDPKLAQILSTRTIKFKTAQSGNTVITVCAVFSWIASRSVFILDHIKSNDYLTTKIIINNFLLSMFIMSTYHFSPNCNH